MVSSPILRFNHKDISPNLTPNHWEKIVHALELSELKANTAPPTPRAAETVENTPIHVAEARLSETQNTAVLTATTAPRYSEAARPESNSEVSPVRNKAARRTLWSLALASIVVMLLGFGWFVLSPNAPATLGTAQSVGTLPGAAEVEGSAREELSVPPIDSSCPDSHPVKGNINDEGEHIFHVEGQRYYEVTDPEACFASAEAAIAEGFRASLR